VRHWSSGDGEGPRGLRWFVPVSRSRTYPFVYARASRDDAMLVIGPRRPAGLLPPQAFRDTAAGRTDHGDDYDQQCAVKIPRRSYAIYELLQ
jgi:hypothetical protein